MNEIVRYLVFSDSRREDVQRLHRLGASMPCECHGLLHGGALRGVLSQVDGEPVGWIECGPLDRHENLARRYGLERTPVAWAIACVRFSAEAPDWTRLHLVRFALERLVPFPATSVHAFLRPGSPLDPLLLAGFRLTRHDPLRFVLRYDRPGGPRHHPAASTGKKRWRGSPREIEFVTEEQILQALRIQEESGGALGRILVDLGFVSEEEMLFALCAQAGMDVVDLDTLDISEGLLRRVPASAAWTYRVIPVSLADGVLTVAMADPLNVSILDDLRFMLGVDVRGAVSNDEQVGRALVRWYPRGAPR